MNRIIFAFRDGRPSDLDALLQNALDLDHAHPMSFLSLADEIAGGVKSLDHGPADGIDSGFDGAQSLSMASLWSAG